MNSGYTLLTVQALLETSQRHLNDKGLRPRTAKQGLACSPSMLYNTNLINDFFAGALSQAPYLVRFDNLTDIGAA